MTDEPLMDKAQLADYLGVPVSWVRDAITARRIPFTRIGRHARFTAEHRAAIVAAGEEPAVNAMRPSPASVVVPFAPRRRQRRSA